MYGFYGKPACEAKDGKSTDISDKEISYLSNKQANRLRSGCADIRICICLKHVLHVVVKWLNKSWPTGASYTIDSMHITLIL